MRTFLATVFALGSAGSVLAGGPTVADPEAPVAVAPAPPVSADWTRLYLGVSGITGTVSDDGGVSDFDTSGYGVHAGYLRDLGTFVVGGELAYSRADIEGEDEDLASTRLKLIGGYDAGRVLPYVFVGFSQVDIINDVESDSMAIYGLGAAIDVTPSLGLGLEYVVEDKDQFDGTTSDLQNHEVALRLNLNF
jgi:outer membrane immunogenic protein